MGSIQMSGAIWHTLRYQGQPPNGSSYAGSPVSLWSRAGDRQGSPGHQKSYKVPKFRQL